MEHFFFMRHAEELGDADCTMRGWTRFTGEGRRAIGRDYKTIRDLSSGDFYVVSSPAGHTVDTAACLVSCGLMEIPPKQMGYEVVLPLFNGPDEMLRHYGISEEYNAHVAQIVDEIEKRDDNAAALVAVSHAGLAMDVICVLRERRGGQWASKYGPRDDLNPGEMFHLNFVDRTISLYPQEN